MSSAVKPAVSINLCCYNSEKYLDETLQSIFAQTFKNWELVIINDGSVDSTDTIISRYMREGWPIVYHAQANRGLSASRNTAINLSSGDYIAFIDHDDLWMPQKLERQVPLFRDPEVGIVFSDAILFNQNGDWLRIYARDKWAVGYCFSTLVREYFLCMPSVVIRRAALGDSEAGWFDPMLRMREEYDVFCRIAHKWKLAMVNEPLAKWRVHKGSFTWNEGQKLLFEELETILEKFIRELPGAMLGEDGLASAVRQLIAIEKASFLWGQGHGKLARREVAPFAWKDRKAFAILIGSHVPRNWIFAMRQRLRGKIVPSMDD